MIPRVFITKPQLWGSENYPHIIVQLSDELFVDVGIVREENPICFWVDKSNEISCTANFNSKEEIVEWFSNPFIIQNIKFGRVQC
jgi:hypothetical protein